MMSTCLEKIDEGHWTLPAATITWIRVLALLLRRVETSRAVQGRCYRRGIVVVQRATTGSVWSPAWPPRRSDSLVAVDDDARSVSLPSAVEERADPATRRDACARDGFRASGVAAHHEGSSTSRLQARGRCGGCHLARPPRHETRARAREISRRDERRRRVDSRGRMCTAAPLLLRLQ